MKSYSFLLVAVFIATLVISSDVSLAQRGGWFGERDSSIGLLQNDKVRDELELVDDQTAELEALRDELTQEMRNMWSGMRDLSREDRREKWEEMRADMDVRRKELEERIQGVLLPHQQKRLDQLFMQSQARRRGGTLGFDASDRLAEKLNLTDEQKEKLKKAAEDAQKELEEKISRLRDKAEQKVLSVLTPEQRKQYTDIMGDSFKFEERDRWGRRDRGDRERDDRRSRDSQRDAD